VGDFFVTKLRNVGKLEKEHAGERKWQGLLTFMTLDKLDNLLEAAQVAEDVGQAKNHAVLLAIVLPGELTPHNVLRAEVLKERYCTFAHSKEFSENLGKLIPTLRDGSGKVHIVEHGCRVALLESGLVAGEDLHPS